MTSACPAMSAGCSACSVHAPVRPVTQGRPCEGRLWDGPAQCVGHTRGRCWAGAERRCVSGHHFSLTLYSIDTQPLIHSWLPACTSAHVSCRLSHKVAAHALSRECDGFKCQLVAQVARLLWQYKAGHVWVQMKCMTSRLFVPVSHLAWRVC